MKRKGVGKPWCFAILGPMVPRWTYQTREGRVKSDLSRRLDRQMEPYKHLRCEAVPQV